MDGMTRREVLGTLGAAAGACLLSGPFAAAQTARPNIIFILADDLGYGDLGCYGQQKIKTPRLDRLAAEGIRFTQCYSGSTVCAPSRCSLMTGMHTGHARIRGNALVPLEPGDTTVAEVLKRAGYRTALFGKWGLGEPDTTGVPNAKGFDEFFGYLNQGHAHNYYPEYLWRNGEKVTLAGNREDPGKRGVLIERGAYSCDLFTEEALAFLDRKQDAPFFMYLAYTLPHANNERGAAEKNGMEVPDPGEYAAMDWPEPQKGHAAMISRLDRDVGRVLDKLAEKGLDKNTWVFFTSDNGTHKEGGADPAFFQSSGPLRGIKRDLYEGGIRVPMIVRGPDAAPGAQTNAGVWAFWDFLPTAAALAGTDAPRCDGVSVAPLLTGGKTAPHPPLYWEFHEGGYFRAVRDGDWKLVKKRDKPAELYDLSNDPAEENDIAEEHPDVVKRLEAFMDSARTPSEKWPGK